MLTDQLDPAEVARVLADLTEGGTTPAETKVQMIGVDGSRIRSDPRRAARGSWTSES